MTIVKSILAAVALSTAALPTFALADAPEQVTLTHEGRTYVYSVAVRGETRVISGYEQSSQTPFTLRLRNGMVRGSYGTTPIAFRAGSARGGAVTVIASR